MTKKVVIVGAGPCGLLLAHYLLRRNDKYEIQIYERRTDPRQTSFSNARTFPITLSLRGQNALDKIDGLWEIVKTKGVEILGSLLHTKNGKTRFFSTGELKSITIDRNLLTITLLETLTQKYDQSKFKIHFDCKCTGVNFDSKQVLFDSSSESFTVDYDLLIGADGARSAVRNSFLKLPIFEYEQKYVPDDYKTVFIPSINEREGVELKSGYIHGWSLEDGTRFLAVPQPDNSCSCTVIFPRNKNQVESLATKPEVLNFFQDNFPEISKLLPEAEAEAFLERPISSILTIRCSDYHYNDSVLIIGDAAHAVSPSLGQGCNAAFEDVAIFDSLLDEYDDDLGQALAQFTIRRKPDVHALLELCESPRPFAKILLIELVLRQKISGILHKMFPQKFPPFLFNMIRETTIPYAEILKSYQNWVGKVKKSNQRFFATLNE